DAQRGKFDIVLAEALDRLSRDQADVAILFKHLRFAGVQIVTLGEGEISELHVGLKGTMNALFLKDLAAKTHRGIRGRVEKGKSGGGLCYGYNVVKDISADGEPIRGERTINEAQAEIIRRVFQEFAAGLSPRSIARRLNDELIPGPHGALWTDSTLRGHAARGTGLINNELYVGKLVWNRLRYVKDPASGKRVSRLNPREKWITREVSQLRIVDDGLWQAAKARQGEIAVKYANVITATRAARLNGAHRPRSLLSGLLVCGCCGGPFSLRGQNRYACSNHVMNGSCANSRTIEREALEARMLDGLRERLFAPEIAAEATRAYAEETNRLNRERRSSADADRRELEKITRSTKEIMTLIEDGGGSRAMVARLRELETREDELTARLSRAPVDMTDIHPNVAGVYRRKVERLAEALQDPQERGEAAEAIRALIERITLRPGAKRGEIAATLHGDLGTILEWTAPKQNTPGAVASGVSVSVVAGAGFDPAAFRL
ncbi:MAG: recombinase family protein, partial [Methylocella sp.]